MYVINRVNDSYNILKVRSSSYSIFNSVSLGYIANIQYNTVYCWQLAHQCARTPCSAGQENHHVHSRGPAQNGAKNHKIFHGYFPVHSSE